jgi:hypothetical protein
MGLELKYIEMLSFEVNAQLAECHQELNAKALKIETGASAAAYIDELIEEKK